MRERERDRVCAYIYIYVYRSKTTKQDVSELFALKDDAHQPSRESRYVCTPLSNVTDKVDLTESHG